jgi:hypothetical protein
MNKAKCVNYVTNVETGYDELLKQFWITCGECRVKFHASTAPKAYRQFKEHNAQEKLTLEN